MELGCSYPLPIMQKKMEIAVLERDLLVFFRAQTLYVSKNPLAFQSQKSIVDGNPCIHMIYKKLSSYNTVAIRTYYP